MRPGVEVLTHNMGHVVVGGPVGARTRVSVIVQDPDYVARGSEKEAVEGGVGRWGCAGAYG